MSLFNLSTFPEPHFFPHSCNNYYSCLSFFFFNLTVIFTMLFYKRLAKLRVRRPCCFGDKRRIQSFRCEDVLLQEKSLWSLCFGDIMAGLTQQVTVVGETGFKPSTSMYRELNGPQIYTAPAAYSSLSNRSKLKTLRNIHLVSHL